jgi:hypothetical protein
MSFPASPTNGQSAVINGITYNYSTSTISWTRQLTANTSTSVYTSFISILNSTASTGTSTGALIVNGGAGINGDINVGGTVKIGGVVPIQLASSYTPIVGNTDFGSLASTVDAFGAVTDSYVTPMDFQISGPVQTIDLSLTSNATANPI